MERVRRNSADITYVVQDTLMEMLFSRKNEDEIFSYITKIDNEFITYDWTYLCKKCGITKSIEEGRGQNYTACRNANKYLGKNYDSGATPYLGVFARGDYPLVIDNKLVTTESSDGTLVVGFGDGDQWRMQRMGFRLDYNTLKKKVFIDKIEPLLKLVFDVEFEETVADASSLLEV